MPAANLAWRVVSDTAELPSDAAVEERALGFALAQQDAVVVNDADSGQQWRIAPGEALFVPGSARQQRASLGTGPTGYYRIALVPAEQAGDAGGDRLLLAGPSFAAPQGRAFDLDLVRDVLRPGERASLASPTAPVLILATEGSVDVGVSGQLPTRLLAGQATALAGNLTISATGTQPAVFVAAVIGPEVPAPPVPPTGSVALTVRACPASVEPAAAQATQFASAVMAACQPAALDPDPTLVLADGTLLGPDRRNPGIGSYGWTGLLYSDFPLGAVTLPAGFDRYAVVDAAGTLIGLITPSGQAASAAFTVTAQSPNPAATLYLFAASTGSITLSSFACPEGVTVNEVRDRAAECVPVDTGFSAEMIAVGDGRAIAPDVAGAPGSPLRWSSIPQQQYQLRFSALPSGYDTYVVPDAEFDTATGAYLIALTGANSDAKLNAYFLQPPAPATPSVPSTPSATGSMTVAVFACPAGMSAQHLDPAACAPTGEASVGLVLADGSRLGPESARVEGNVLTWSDVPLGIVGVEVLGLPVDVDAVVAPGADVSSTQPPTFQLRLSQEVANGGIAVYALRSGTAASPTP